MNVLMIGAGAVAQAYGRHFQLGGADLFFFVREKYAEAARQGFDLYPLNERRRAAGPVRLAGFGVLTTLDEVRATTWDQVVVCVSSTALRSGSWFDELCGVIGEANVVSLSPGLDDKEYVLARVPEDRAVFGLIALVSYPGPLPGEELPRPGMVYWVPPLTWMSFSGAEAPTRAVVALLNKGGLPSKGVEDTAADAAFAAPVLQMLVIGQEAAGWDLRALCADRGRLGDVCEAMHEAFAVAELRTGRRTPIGLRLLRPWLLRALVKLATQVVPFDLEKFLAFHFKKVGDQTAAMLSSWIESAKGHGLSHEAMERL